MKMQRVKEISVLVLALISSIAILGVVRAWTGPSATPPDGSGAITVSSGNVGIGTASPEVALDIVGDILLDNQTGEIAFEDSSGANDVMLQYNSSNYLIVGYGVDAAGDVRISPGAGARMTIQGDGDVGIGTTSPGYKLQVAGTVGATAYYYTSDISLKTDISPLSGTLNDILKLSGVHYRWKDTGTLDMGLIAQDVEKVFPEFVSTSQETGIKSVDYAKLTVPLIEAVKEQQAEIDELRQEIERLKAK